MNADLIKNPESEKIVFFRFPRTLNFHSRRTNSNGDILQKALTFFFFYVYWISQFEGHSTQCSQIMGKTVFARLRKLQSLKAVEF